MRNMTSSNLVYANLPDATVLQDPLSCYYGHNLERLVKVAMCCLLLSRECCVLCICFIPYCCSVPLDLLRLSRVAVVVFACLILGLSSMEFLLIASFVADGQAQVRSPTLLPL
jgi:hypothetical protein